MSFVLILSFSAVNDIMNQEYLFMDDEFDERDADVGPMTQGLVSDTDMIRSYDKQY